MPVKLTDAQLQLRSHQVTGRSSNGFHVAERDRLTFKRGEIVELATELPKAMIVNETVLALEADGTAKPAPAASKPTPGPKTAPGKPARK
jgi:hypothetical protein